MGSARVGRSGIGRLLATNGVQLVAAQAAADCPVANDASGAVTCTASGGMATIEFIGSSIADETTTRQVYVVHDGGQHTRYPQDTTHADATGFTNDAIMFDHQTVEIAAPAVKDLVLTPSTTTITVSSGTVYVYEDLANFVDVTSGGTLPADSPQRFTDVADATVTITFLGAPAAYDDTTTNGSQLTGTATISDTSDSAVTITAEVDGNALTGQISYSVDYVDGSAIKDGRVDYTTQVDADGNALTGQISYSVDYVDGSAIKDGRVDYTTQVMDFDASDGDGTTHMVSGWQTDGAVRVIVSARFEGDTGSLDLTFELSRTGDAAMITSTVYECAEPVVPITTLCTQEAQALATDDADDDPSAAGAFDPGATLMIHSTAVDSLGSAVDIGFTASEVVAEGAEAALGTIDPQTDADTTVGSEAVAYIQHTLPDADDIALGAYTITVEDAGENAETTVAIIVSGPAENYALSGPAYIPLAAFSSAEYTVTITDANGNPPTGENEVSIVVQGVNTSDVTGGGVQMAGADGTVTFSIRVPFGAMQGDQAAIGVLVDGEVKASMIVTFGDAPVPGFSAPSAVAVAVDDAGVPTVTWMAGDSADSQVVIVVNAADDTDYCLGVVAGDASSHTCTDALTSGASYVVLVIALDGQGGYMLGNVAAHTAS